MNAIHVHVLNVMLFLASHRQGPPHTEHLWQANVPSCCRKPFFVGASGWPGLSPAMTLAQLWWIRENNSRPAHFSLTLRHMLMGARRHTISCTLSYGQSAHTAKGGGCMNREHSKLLCGKTKKQQNRTQPAVSSSKKTHVRPRIKLLTLEKMNPV